jgi:hypothetical protein
MATTTPISDNATQPDPGAPASGLLVSLTPLSAEALEATLANLAAAFPSQTIDIATSDSVPASVTPPNFRLTTYSSATPATAAWMLTAADYLSTHKLLQDRPCPACLLLGPESQSLAPETLRALADGVLSGRCDLALPHYDLGPRDGLVNSAILYPVTRALFATRPRYPLAVDLAFSPRMIDRLAACAQRSVSASQPTALVWPVAEAATINFTLIEVPAGPRALPSPDTIDLNSILAQVAGSFFADIDAKAAFWQRPRLAYPPKAAPPLAEPAHADPAAGSSEAPDVQPMLDSFRLAYTNLHEIWSLVLPPNSLLGLKKLSLMPAASFRMADELWVRIVYDFILAYRLRTLNRGHLLGALTPLYLAWVASHLLQTSLQTSDAGSNPAAPEKHIEALAVAFEIDKPYLVSRWRWPDRFNP